MYNKVIIVGHTTRDIELKYAQSGTAIASSAIASSRKFTSNGEKKEETMFIDITFFGRTAEIANQYIHKGSKILIEGRLVFDQWVDQNGGKRSKHNLIVDSMQMLDNKDSNPSGNDQRGGQNGQSGGGGYNQPNQQQNNAQSNYKAPQQQQSQTAYQAPQQQQQQRMPDQLPSIDIDENEIPF